MMACQICCILKRGIVLTRGQSAPYNSLSKLQHNIQRPLHYFYRLSVFSEELGGKSINQKT